MNITKYGHCCLLIEIDGKNILTDPGEFSVLPKSEELPRIDIVLITHEHVDHLHVDSLKTVIEKNPEVIVVTNTSVGKILDEEKIVYVVIDDGKEETVDNLKITGHGKEHAIIFEEYGAVENTGYFFGDVNDTFFYPGDAFTDPGKPITVVAVPVAAPWMAVKEAISYVQKIKPTHCFPVHDAVLSEVGREVTFRVFDANTKNHTQFHPLDAGESVEL